MFIQKMKIETCYTRVKGVDRKNSPDLQNKKVMEVYDEILWQILKIFVAWSTRGRMFMLKISDPTAE